MSNSNSVPDAISASIVQTSLLLCRCIEEWQAETASEGDGSLNWTAITEKMKIKTGKTVSSADLKIIWKFVAYGKHVAKSEGIEEITFSDDEDPYYQPFSAIKRHKHAKIQEQDKNNAASATLPSPPTPPQQRHYLPSSLPMDLKAKVLSQAIQINIPDHIRLGKIGIQPPIYLPSREMIHPNTAVPGGGKVRNSLVTHLAAVGNPSFLGSLRPSISAYKPPINVANRYAINPQALSASGSLSTTGVPNNIQPKIPLQAMKYPYPIPSAAGKTITVPFRPVQSSSGATVAAATAAIVTSTAPTISGVSAKVSNSCSQSINNFANVTVVTSKNITEAAIGNCTSNPVASINGVAADVTKASANAASSTSAPTVSVRTSGASASSSVGGTSDTRPSVTTTASVVNAATAGKSVVAASKKRPIASVLAQPNSNGISGTISTSSHVHPSLARPSLTENQLPAIPLPYFAGNPNSASNGVTNINTITNCGSSANNFANAGSQSISKAQQEKKL